MEALTNHLWQSTLFACAIAVTTFAFRYHHARVRYGLWFAASVKFLVPFAVLIALGRGAHWAPAAQRLATPTVSRTLAQVSEPFSIRPAVEAVAVPAPAFVLGWRFLAMTIWAIGFLAIAMMRLRLGLRLRAIARKSQRRELCATLPAGVEIRTCDELLEPGVIGIWRSTLLLPVGIETHLPAEQLRAVLMHELTHVKRRDNLTATIHMVVESVFWFHPLVWWIGARLIEEREHACDEAVLQTIGDPHVYAEGIFNVCKRYVESPLACVSGASGADLKRRIEAIIANRTCLTMSASYRCLLAATALFAIGAPVMIGAVVRSEQDVRLEVASIKPATGGLSEPMPNAPNLFSRPSISLQELVAWAYGVPRDRIIGGPGWVSGDRFEVIVKMTAAPTLPQLRSVLQQVLIERFQLRIHHEPKEMPLLNLVVARSDHRLGPGIKKADVDCMPFLTGQRPMNESPVTQAADGGAVPRCQPRISTAEGTWTLALRGITTAWFADTLQRTIAQPVRDGTGLSGAFDIETSFVDDNAPRLPGSERGSDALSVFTALPEQLGLKLESSRGPVDVVVVDAAQHPSAN